MYDVQAHRGSQRAGAWAAAIVGAAAIYVSGAFLSIWMELDNLDSGSGPSPSDEILLAVLGVVGVSLVAAPFLAGARGLPRRGALRVTATAVAGVVSASLMLSAYASDTALGEPVPARARLSQRAALCLIAVAPLVAGIVAGRKARRELFVGAATLTAAMWFIALAVLMIDDYG